jgi:probable phosphoglycerate mutase
VNLMLMRHGEPARGSADPRDPELSCSGVEQVRRMLPHLIDASIDHVYSSPQVRARETAGIVAEAIHAQVHLDDGLLEFDHGSTYVHYDASSPVWKSYFAGDLSPWGLTADEFHARVAAVVERLFTRHSGQRVLAVCHGGVINAWTCQVLGVRERIRVIEPAYASLHRYAPSADEWRVVSLNETAS